MFLACSALFCFVVYRCMANCKQKRSSVVSVALHADCTNCQHSYQLTYRWTVDEVIDGVRHSLTGDSLLSLVTEPQHLGYAFTTKEAGNVLLNRQFEVCVHGE